MKSILVVFSYHHKNTEKIANTISKVLCAQIVSPRQISPEELKDFDLIGFGSGIYSDQHHKTLQDLVDKMPRVEGKKAFIFSTFGVPAVFVTGQLLEEARVKNHSMLRDKLKSKGYIIADEFCCVGYNTNSFLKLFGGINKGRPNEDDCKKAEIFAENLIQNFS
jgi:flavodoxin